LHSGAGQERADLWSSGKSPPEKAKGERKRRKETGKNGSAIRHWRKMVDCADPIIECRAEPRSPPVGYMGYGIQDREEFREKQKFSRSFIA
jgi:hypothetical protein